MTDEKKPDEPKPQPIPLSYERARPGISARTIFKRTGTGLAILGATIFAGRQLHEEIKNAGNEAHVMASVDAAIAKARTVGRQPDPSDMGDREAVGYQLNLAHAREASTAGALAILIGVTALGVKRGRFDDRALAVLMAIGVGPALADQFGVQHFIDDIVDQQAVLDHARQWAGLAPEVITENAPGKVVRSDEVITPGVSEGIIQGFREEYSQAHHVVLRDGAIGGASATVAVGALGLLAARRRKAAGRQK